MKPNTYYIYWLDGKFTKATGFTREEAFTNSGYGAGAARAVDFIDTSKNQRYTWDKDKRDWVKQSEDTEALQ